MKITKILPSFKKVQHLLIAPVRIKETVNPIAAPSVNLPALIKPMSFRPVMLSDKAKEALEAINSMRNKKLFDEVMTLGEFIPEPYKMQIAMKNGDTVEISRPTEINPNLNFVFFDKKGKEREQIMVATHTVICDEAPGALCAELSSIKGQVHCYSTTRNTVMRPTDPLNSDPKREMDFEETVRTRPVVLKRINSMLIQLGDEISQR